MNIYNEMKAAAALKQNGNHNKYWMKSKYVPWIEDEKHRKLAAGEFIAPQEETP